MDRHPELIRALSKVVLSFSKEKELELFRKGVGKIIQSHLVWMSDWVDTNRNIFSKIDKATADTHEDDMAICLFAIDEWENEDRAVGMRYTALCKRFKKLMTAERKQILKEELDKQENKIIEMVKKASTLAKDWKAKLENHTYDPYIAIPLTWLESVTVEELKRNYLRWEKENL